MHVNVHSERAVNKVIEWADQKMLSYYVAPKQESSERNPADHVTIMGVSEELAGNLMGYIVANGLKTEITVE